MAVQSGLGRVKSNLASSVRKGKMSQEAADAVAKRVTGTLDYSDFGSVDMVSINGILHAHRNSSRSTFCSCQRPKGC